MEDKLKQGETLFAEGKIEEAEKYFLDIVNENPEDEEALNNLGVISHAIGNFDNAEDYLLKALSVKDEHLDVLLNLADLYQSTNRWREAAVQLKKYISIYNQDHNVFNQLATVYLEVGNTQNARSALEKSLALKPDQDIIKESLQELEKGNVITSYLPTSGSFRGAFAEINITPNVSEQNSVFLQGMGGPPRRATTVSEPLMMQLLLLEDDHFTKVLFVTADLFGFGPEIVDTVQAVVAQWGIEPEGLILNASHTHYAPGTISHVAKELGPFYEEYSNQIAQTIGQHLELLYNKLEECEILWGKVEAQIGVSRRLKKDGKVAFAPNPEGYYDKDTPFIHLHMLKTDKKVLLVSHGCHPTGLGSESVISADYPGYMRNTLKSKGVADGVMFLQGSAGSTKETVSVNGDVLFCENSTGAKENGEFLATQIMSGLKKELQPLNGSFFCTKRQISLPVKSPPPPSVLTQIRDNAGKDNLVREWTSSLLSRFPNGDFPARLAMEVQLVSLGDKVSFITLPGEPVAELARDLRRLTSNPDSTFVLGYTNGLMGYLPTDVMIEEGGYETDASQYVYLLPSALDRGAQSNILSKAQECISAASDKDKFNGYGRYHLIKKSQKAFFVLSAGRCGTMTLAHLLNTASNARVWHHPQPDPINESLQAYRNNIDKRKTFWKARYSIIHKTWSQGLNHGETDLLMTPFSDMITKEIPDSKFIVLVRDPRHFVRSGMRRNYYHGHPWDFGRLRPKERSKEFDKWNRKDQFEKICWLWRETYDYILKFIHSLSKEQVLLVRFEDLVGDNSKTEELFDFLGLQGFDNNKVEQILRQKFNSQQEGYFAKPKDWPKKLSNKLWNECGEVAKTLGYKNDNGLAIDRKVDDRSVHEVKYKQNKKLVFIELPGTSTGGHLDHIVDCLNQDYQVRYVKTSNHNEIIDLVNWADIVWLEWANQMAVHVTNKIPQIKDKNVICRLHGYEVFTDMPTHINWSVVDRLIFVAKHKQEIFNKKFKIQSLQQTILRNGVNINKFTIAENKKNTKRLVLLGHINFRKGLPLLLQFYHELLKHDPEYYLYIRGEFQDHRLEIATHTMIRELSLTGKLEFVDWVDDLNSWLADKSHILSFSLEESFHYAIGNGMAAGMKPVIHAWNESRDIWPQEFIFNDLDGFLRQVMDQKYEPERYRNLLFDNQLTCTTQIEKIREVFEELDISASKDQESIVPGQKDILNSIVVKPWQQKSNQNKHSIKHEQKTNKEPHFSKDKLTLKEISNDLKNRYQTNNQLRLLLKHNESIHDYMNLEYYLKNIREEVSQEKLIYLLQTTFHKIVTPYFNTLTIPKSEELNALAILNLLENQKGFANSINGESKESFIYKLYHLLEENLPRSNDKKIISLMAMNDVLKKPEATNSIVHIYHTLKKEFQGLYDNNYLSSFMIHGSMSTLDFTSFSDIDTQFFLSDKAFSSTATIKQIAEIISKANIHIRLFDPLQHHGYFISTDLDRTAYPQSYLPLKTMENATAVLGDKKHKFSLRSPDYENKFSVWHMGYFFRVSHFSQNFPKNPFDMKRFLSRFSMLPVLYLELFENIYPYKRDAFTIAQKYFPSTIWDVFEIVSLARKKWNSDQMIKFNPTFYQRVFEFSELMLDRLQELSND